MGFGSEEIFNMTGEILIEEIRERKNKALQVFEEIIEGTNGKRSNISI